MAKSKTEKTIDELRSAIVKLRKDMLNPTPLAKQEVRTAFDTALRRSEARILCAVLGHVWGGGAVTGGRRDPREVPTKVGATRPCVREWCECQDERIFDVSKWSERRALKRFINSR